MISYYYLSAIGIRHLHANISIDKMALPDSYLHDFQHAFESALRNMQPITIFVMKPGDLRDPARMKGSFAQTFPNIRPKTDLGNNQENIDEMENYFQLVIWLIMPLYSTSRVVLLRVG